MEMKHRKPSKHRCQNYCAVCTEYCWYLLKKYMNLVVQPTREHDQEGKLVKQLGLFAELGLLPKQQLRNAGTSFNGPLCTLGSIYKHYPNFQLHMVQHTDGHRLASLVEVCYL